MSNRTTKFVVRKTTLSKREQQRDNYVLAASLFVQIPHDNEEEAYAVLDRVREMIQELHHEQ
jgi:hypothetical protein